MIRIFLTLLTTLILGFPAASYAHKDATGIVKERMDLFKKSQQDIKALYASIRSDELEDIRTNAVALAQWGAVMPDYFPEGSGGGVSAASAEIWKDFDGFKDAAKTFESAALSVVAAVDQGDK
ncbi:MAG: cytochrome c, partial [Alphaproteobacteria bacterium]